MTSIQEGTIRISVPRGGKARKFDDPTIHGLSHCMKAVDFIVEEDDRYWFIEIKDPDDPGCDGGSRDDFKKRFLAENIDENLKYKYRDSFLYEWAAGRADKPIYYVVLVALADLTKAELLIRTDALKRKLPISGPSEAAWARPFVANCIVFNLDTWNAYMPRFRATRVI